MMMTMFCTSDGAHCDYVPHLGGSDVVQHLTQADVDRLHAPGLWDVLGVVLQSAALTIGYAMMAVCTCYALVKAFLWLRDLHSLVRYHRATR